MDIIANRRENRSLHINQIIQTISKAFAAGITIDKEKFVYQICSDLRTSRRTSIEYLNIALVSINCTEETIDGRKVLVGKKVEGT